MRRRSFSLFLVNLTCFGFLDLSELTDKDYFSKPTFVRFLIQNRTLLGHSLPIPNVVAVLREIHSLAIAHGDVQDAMNSEHDSVELNRRVTRRGSIRTVVMRTRLRDTTHTSNGEQMNI